MKKQPCRHEWIKRLTVLSVCAQCGWQRWKEEDGTFTYDDTYIKDYPEPDVRIVSEDSEFYLTLLVEPYLGWLGALEFYTEHQYTINKLYDLMVSGKGFTLFFGARKIECLMILCWSNRTGTTEFHAKRA